MEEEIALLEEQLATAHADIERLQARLGEATARAGGYESEAGEMRRRLAALEAELAERDGALTARQSEIETLQASLSEAASDAAGAADRYRGLLLAAEPALPADLVTGATIAEVDEAAERARQTVAQVRQHLEQQAQVIRVPAGSPPRAAPDFSDLSPAEKIRAGLQDR